MVTNEYEAVATEFGVFAARLDSDCLKISVPARTYNEHSADTEFIDLPFMTDDEFKDFVDAVGSFVTMFHDKTMPAKKYETVTKEYGVFVATRKGDGKCIKISVPNNCVCALTEFLELPLMYDDEVKNFVDAVGSFGSMFHD